MNLREREEVMGGSTRLNRYSFYSVLLLFFCGSTILLGPRLSYC